MDDDIAIKVDHVSKKYCKSLKSSMLYGVNDIAKNALGFSSHSDRLRKDEFWAVDDVSFELKKGEALGIIGHNGSGKTTFLKMLNGIFWPDKGKITVKGKVGALIEVGAGFHPLLTGRENIYVNGAILGMNKKEIDEKFDDIVAFADIGDFLDTPVKNYSSGMYVRLGFAIAVHSEPDILLIDEILAVGDLEFQSKCLDVMSKLRRKGATIVLVSHHMPKIGSFCDRVLLLSGGKVMVLDKPHVAIEIFEYEMNEKSSVCAIGNVPASYPRGGALIEDVSFNNQKNIEKIILKFKEKINISFTYDFKKLDIDDCCIGILAYRKNDGLRCFGILSQEYNLKLNKSKGIIDIIIENHNLIPNEYVFDIQIRSITMDVPFATYRVQNVRISFLEGWVHTLFDGVYNPSIVKWDMKN